MMTEYLAIAKPYAKAVFELANQQDMLQKWFSSLQIFGELVTQPEMHALLKNPAIAQEKMSQFFYESLPSNLLDEQVLQTQVKNFIKLLIENKRLLALPAIFKVFQELVNQHEHVIRIEIISALALDNEQREALIAALQKRFNAQVLFDFKLDSSLIGGVIIRCGNWVMDGSVKGKLQRLHSQLVGGL